MKFSSSRQFLIFYFQDIMDVCYGEFWNEKSAERVKEMKGLIEQYRTSFRLQRYSNVQIWKRIKKLYDKDWDDLLFEHLNKQSPGE